MLNKELERDDDSKKVITLQRRSKGQQPINITVQIAARCQQYFPNFALA